MKSINTVIEFFLISQILKIEPVKIKTAEMEEEGGGGSVLRILFHTSIKHERKYKDCQPRKQITKWHDTKRSYSSKYSPFLECFSLLLAGSFRTQ